MFASASAPLAPWVTMQQLFDSRSLSCISAQDSERLGFLHASKMSLQGLCLSPSRCSPRTKQPFVPLSFATSSEFSKRHFISEAAGWKHGELPAGPIVDFSSSKEGLSPTKKQCATSHCHLQTSEVLAFIGRALLLLGFAFFSMPAMAKPISNSTSSQRNMVASMGSSESTSKVGLAERQKEDLMQSSEEQEPIGTADATSTDTLYQTDKEADSDRLSDAFWKGIPIPEKSRLQSLKVHLDMNPNDFRALSVLLRMVMEKRDMLRTLTVLEKLVEVQPSLLKWKFLKARTHETLGELSMARAGYEELVNLRPLSARFLQGLVMLLNRAGDEEVALELIQTAIDRAMSESKTIEAGNLRMLLGQLYTQQGNYKEALKEFESIIAQDSEDFRPYLCQGLVYTLLGEEAKAQQSLDKYQQLCPKDFLVRQYLDDLMLKAKTGSQYDNILKNNLKRPFKKQDRKPMKQPSSAGKKPAAPKHGLKEVRG